jgi:hypothetical protein
METPYACITEIREAGTSDEANELLNGGFVLIKAVEKRETDALGRQASRIVYILGRLKASGNGSPAQPKEEPPGGSKDTRTGEIFVNPAILENLTWRAYNKGEGEWTFVTNQDGSPIAGLEPAKEFLERLRDGEDLIVGGYKYRLRDKFLKRYPANE